MWGGILAWSRAGVPTRYSVPRGRLVADASRADSSESRLRATARAGRSDSGAQDPWPRNARAMRRRPRPGVAQLRIVTGDEHSALSKPVSAPAEAPAITSSTTVLAVMRSVLGSSTAGRRRHQPRMPRARSRREAIAPGATAHAELATSRTEPLRARDRDFRRRSPWTRPTTNSAPLTRGIQSLAWRQGRTPRERWSRNRRARRTR